MSIVSFRSDQLLTELPPPTPVPVPLGEPVSGVSVRSFTAQSGARTGVWECSPGVWRRQVLQAEFCTFLAGKAVFEPDAGDPVRIEAGQSVYFPANTGGVWRVEETLRKIYIIFDEKA